MAICETCDYANRPPYKSPCSECDKTMGSPFCCYEHEEKPTNADRIRAMSDEELADALQKFCIAMVDCSDCPLYDFGCPKNSIFNYWIEWLQQPAEIKKL